MKILVTGATGNVGKFVINELIKMKENVVAADISIQKVNLMFSDLVEARYLDFLDSSTFDEVLIGIDRVFLMRPPHIGKPKDLYPFIDAMKKHNVKLVSFLSLMGVEKNTIPPHHKIEKYIEKLELPYAHIRPSFFMQNLSGVHADEIKNLNQIYVPAGKSKTSFIDAKDIGLAVATILKDYDNHINSAYTLTGPEALDYYEIANIISNVTGKQITYKNMSLLRYRRYYINERKLDKKYVNVTVALYLMTRLGTARFVTRTFAELTKQEPTSFRSFVEDHIKCFTQD